MLPPDRPTIFKTHLLPKHVLSLSLQFLLPSSKGPGSHFTPPPPLKRHHCYLSPSTVHSEAKIPLLSLLVCCLIMTLSRSRVPQSFPSYLIINLYLLTLFHWRSHRFPLLLRLTLVILLLNSTLILHPIAQTLDPNSQNRRYHHNRIPDRNSLNHRYRHVQAHCRTPDRNSQYRHVRIPISHYQNRM